MPTDVPTSEPDRTTDERTAGGEHGRRPLALVTNDDGVEGLGLALLVVAALETGHDVVVAAPSTDRSGASAAVDAQLDDDRLPVAEVGLPWPDLVGPGQPSEDPRAWCAEARLHEGTDRLRVLAVGASPAFCVRAGLRGAFGRVPDVVLSGVNHGLNTGAAVLHSGTVGAALTATVFGVPALAVSAGVVPGRWLDVAPTTWAAVLEAVRPAVRWVLDHEPVAALSLNVPHVEDGGHGVRGLRPATLAAAGAAQGVAFERGEGWVRMAAPTPPDDDGPEDPGSDTVLLGEGFATATLLRPVEQAAGVDLDDLGAPARAGG